jgi:hypothetical protein
MLRRRQLLAASATTLPLFAALTACAGPDPLAGPPPLSADVRGLFDAVTAEQNLIWIYNRTIGSYSALKPALAALLAEHQAHLGQLRAMIVEPPGRVIPSTVTRKPAVPGTQGAALAQLRAAEQSAAAGQLRRLAGASPALAQLYASIAASENTHVTALTTVTSGSTR